MRNIHITKDGVILISHLIIAKSLDTNSENMKAVIDVFKKESDIFNSVEIIPENNEEVLYLTVRQTMEILSKFRESKMIKKFKDNIFNEIKKMYDSLKTDAFIVKNIDFSVDEKDSVKLYNFFKTHKGSISTHIIRQQKFTHHSRFKKWFDATFIEAQKLANIDGLKISIHKIKNKRVYKLVPMQDEF